MKMLPKNLIVLTLLKFALIIGSIMIGLSLSLHLGNTGSQTDGDGTAAMIPIFLGIAVAFFFQCFINTEDPPDLDQ